MSGCTLASTSANFQAEWSHDVATDSTVDYLPSVGPTQATLVDARVERVVRDVTDVSMSVGATG